MPEQGEQALLEARLEDYLSRAERGSLAVSRFLTPREKKEALRYLTSRGAREQIRFWGGYAGAERECLFVIPDFYVSVPELMPADGVDPASVLPDPDAVAVASVRVNGSGFRVLSHRDYLGALLNLGLERDAIGDIAVQNDFQAMVFCASHLVPFLCDSLLKVASDSVRCFAAAPDASFTDGRHYRPISDTVASNRLDCVVAALLNQSRDSAQNLIRSGFVDVDFEPASRTDLPLSPPVTISIRGSGRFILRSFAGETRKGRLRMIADLCI